MEIKKINPSELEGFAELIKPADRTQNTCICSEILSKPAAQAKILDALANNAHRLSKLSAATGDDYYANNAEENRKLWQELRTAFGFDD
jgi:hypothetical protein